MTDVIYSTQMPAARRWIRSGATVVGGLDRDDV